MGVSSHRHGRSGQLFKQKVYAMWGRTCHLCGHPGADSVDHLIPLSVDPNQPRDPTQSRPAHGVDGCPTCGRKCNTERGNKPIEQHYKPPIEW